MIDLAEPVMYIAMFDYALGNISEGTEGGFGRMVMEEMVATGQCDHFCIAVGNAALGTYMSSELYGKRVVLEYRPTTLGNGFARRVGSSALLLTRCRWFPS